MAKHNNLDLARSGEQQERITIAFLALAWIFILLRIWTRTFVISSFGWDDSTMILAGMIFTVYCAALLYIEANGGGTHVRDLAQLQLLTKWVVVSEVTYIIAMMVLKISLGIFFARIIIKPWQFMLIYVTVTINIFSSAAAFFYCLFRCGPDIDQYVVHQLSHKCTPQSLDRFMAFQQAAFTTLTDMMFIILPIFILWNAQMDRQSKFSVGFILSLAAVGCICSMIRFRFVDGLTQTDDFFWNAVNITIWSTIEAGASIIAGCLATLRPFLMRIVNGARGPNSLSGCIKQISKSIRSTDRSTSDSNASSIPHYNTASSPSAFGRKGQRATEENTYVEEPTFLEFLAPQGNRAVQSSCATGAARASTELDLDLTEPSESALQYPWPVTLGVKEQEQPERKRQTVHASWTLRRGVAGDGRTGTGDRPLSAPEWCERERGEAA